MKEHTYTTPKRIIAMILSLVMVLYLLPTLSFDAQAAAGLTSGTVVADASTMDEWMGPFLPNGLPSTDYAGSIWTDKSVLTAGPNLPGGVTIGQNHFLVALSALATNSVVMGQGAVPTDVVFVLDISGSMNGNYSGMVDATNNAIRTMMADPENRVGVVLYSSDTVETLLPLDHYTGVASGDTTVYLSYYSGDGYGSIITGTRTRNQNGGGYGGGYGGGSNYTYTRPTNSKGEAVAKSVTCGGGTYIQGGVWTALTEHFNGVTLGTDETRVPAIILMSDGAPTYNTSAFDNVDAKNPSHGAGDSSFAGDGFVTGLTISYLREQLKAKYGRALIYTVGFGLDSIDNDRDEAVATKVLNPSVTHEEIDKLWSTYLALPAGGEMTVGLGMNGERWNDPDYEEDTTITKSATALSANYVERYLAASDAGTLNDAFQNIVNDISLQAGYYPTRTDDNGVNYSGYITFSDTLGSGMELKEMKGILLNGQLHDGFLMAQAILDPTSPNWVGSKENPTTMGDEFVRAVKARMGIHVEPASDSDADIEAARVAENNIAWELIANAYNEGQLAYNKTDNTFSNYIAWYGDANGNYLAPYKENGTRPGDAAYVNFCYGMLGATEATGQQSDLMYVTVQVSRNLQTGERMVTFQVPASMLPTLTYRVNVELDENNQVKADTATISVNDDKVSPIVLLYEVGVDETLVNPLTIQNYGKPTGDGRYYLYASAWDTITNKGELKNTQNNAMTYAYFEPGPENEHYYFPQDTLIYQDTNGTLYTGSAHPSGKMYFKDVVYTATGTKGTDGKYKATVETKYVEIAAADLINAVENAADGTWYMPKGTLYANTYNYDLAKTANASGTHGHVHYGIVDATVGRSGTHHYQLMYQGNNGRLIYEPAQGITLQKLVAQGATIAADEVFQFAVTVTGDTDGKVTLAQGGTTTEKTLTGGKLELSLKAGETAQIYDIDAGATYTVEEIISDDKSYEYQVVLVNGVSAKTASGTVQPYSMSSVVFTNDTIDYSKFTITKAVTYNNGTAAVTGAMAQFDVEVTLTGYANRKVEVSIGTATAPGTPTEMTTDANGKLALKIQDGQVIAISRVPVGTAYSVKEVGTMPTGYTATVGSGSGTVAAEATGVLLQNSYTPTKVDPQASITVSGTKYLRAANSTTPLTDWNTLSFNIKLQYWDTARTDLPENNKWVDVATDTVTRAEPQYNFLLQRDFEAVGSYMFRIIEDDSANIPGMTYDQTRNLFRVRVTDNDLDGTLEIAAVESVQYTTVTPGAGVNTWNVTADFNNIYDTVNATWIPSAVKTLVGRELMAGEFTFELSEVSGSKTDGSGGFKAVPMPKDANGQTVTQVLSGKGGNIRFPAIGYTPQDVGYTFVYKLTELEPADKVPGVTYDKTVWIAEVAVDWTVEGGNTVGTTVTFHKEGDTTPAAAMTFTNTYKAASVAAGPFNATKTLTNLTPGVAGPMAMTAGQFQFVLTPVNGAPMPADALDGKLSNKADGTITIPAITYTAAGTYQYTLSEVDGKVGGYTYDKSSYTITVVVTDDGSGQLKIGSTTFALNGTTPTQVSRLTFANTYLAQPTGTIGLGGLKTLTMPQDKGLARVLKAGEFSFTLAGNGITETVTNNADGSFAFSDLQFSQAGTYEYTVSEVLGRAGGVTYDGMVHKLVITVTDNKAGQLVATATLNGAPVDIANILFAFTNQYNVTDATLPMVATKSLEGRDLNNGEFSFVLTAKDNAPMPEGAVNGVLTVKNMGGQANFGTAVYTKAGIYTYTIHEVKGSLGGVTYDETVYTVTVTVIDNLNGGLEASITKVEGNLFNDLVFRNIYSANDAVVHDIVANKTLTNKTPGANSAAMAVLADAFQFQLKAVTANAPMPAGSSNGVFQVTNHEGGAVIIPYITFTDAGIYEYTLAEIPGSAKGYTYDDTVYEITVTVTDDGSGQLKAAVAYAVGGQVVTGMTFANEYLAQAAEPVELTGLKKLENRPLNAGEFSFNLKGHGTDETVSNDADGKFQFSKLKFEAAGTYVYTVTEETGNLGGVTYDKTTYTITITVTDDGSGKLKAEITKVEGGKDNSIVFTNTYAAKPATGIVLGGTKELTGRPAAYPLKDGEFSFNLKGNGIDETVQNVGGKFTFSGLSFDTTGEFNYTITEVPGGLDYITYDPATYRVKITVTDDNKGQLVANVEYLDGTPAFVNKYQAKETGAVTIGGEKTLTGRPTGLQAGEFSFNLKGNGTDETVKNDANGKFQFADLTFDKAGTYVYTVTEVAGSVGGVTYDKTTYTVTVTVTDDGSGKLQAATKVEGGNSSTILFANTYKAENATGVVIEAEKVLTDITSGGSAALTPKTGDFSFTLKGNGVNETVQNVGGKITFSALSFDKAGTYTYTISEVKGSLPGIGYDESVITVTVTVTDNGEGSLVAKVSYDKTPQFKNTFKAEDASIVLAGLKTLTGGRDLKDGEFSFNLKGNGVDETVKNNADGKFAFSALTFDQIGTYTYEMTEVRGDDKQVAYDPAKYTITVTVTYADGVMTAKATVEGKTVDSYGFTNIFTPDAVTVDIDVQKILVNKTDKVMGLDGFLFNMVGEGKEQTIASNTDGIAKFTLSFDKAGTYTYKFSEVKGSVEGMTYDSSVQEVKIVVTQDPTTGELKATVEGKAAFTNVLADLPPKTADDFNLNGLLLMMSLSLVCMMAVLVLGKKQMF